MRMLPPRPASILIALLLTTPVPAETQTTAEINTARADALIARLERAATPAEAQAAALAIAQDYWAKLRLKEPAFADKGRKFYQAMKGDAGLMTEVRKRAQAQLIRDGWSPELVNQLTSVENLDSRMQQKAPMDIDEGLLSRTAEENRALRGMMTRGKVTGNEAIAAFTADAQRAYRDALNGVAGSVGVQISEDGLKVIGLTVATPWHPEAYLASEVLKEGGVSSVSLLQQTVDVTGYKLSELEARYLELVTLKRGDEAIVEAARATLKDVNKVQSAFREVTLAGGAIPTIDGSSALIARLRDIVADPSKASGLSRVEVADLFDRCRGLIGKMEAAFVAQGPAELLKVRLYKQLPAETRRAAVIALANGEPVPEAARWIESELTRVAGTKLVSVREEPVETFIARLKLAWPDYQLSSSDDAVAAVLKRMDTLSASDLTVLVGPRASETFAATRLRMPAALRSGIYQRLVRAETMNVVEKNTFLLVQKAPARASVSADAVLATVISLASGLASTAEIMDRNLSPEAERRALFEAWVGALPVTGEILQGLASVNTYVVSGEAGQIGEAALSIAMGVSWVVPGAQVPVLAATVASGTVKSLWSFVESRRDRMLIDDWVESGDWDLQTGVLKGLIDGRGVIRPISVPALFRDGSAPYHTARHTPLSDSIRKSLIDYLDRSGFEKQSSVEALTTALTRMFPDFKPMDALRLPGRDGMAMVQALVNRDGGKGALGLYGQLERLHEAAAADALLTLKQDAELEFQTTHMVGKVREVFEKLKALELKLKVPLEQRVRATENAVTLVVSERLKTPWERHGVEARIVERVAAYVSAYAAIDQQLQSVRQAFQAEGVAPPDNFNLTGYRAVDEARVTDLAAAYLAAIRRAKDDASRLAAQANVTYNPSAACSVDIRQALVRLAGVQVLARDLSLLAEQWSGRAAAANESRDAAIEQARVYASEDRPLPMAVWQKAVAKVEEAYAWAGAPEAWAGGDFSNLAAVARERLARATSEYDAALRDGARRVAEGCQSPKDATQSGKPSTGGTTSGINESDPEQVCNWYNDWYEKVYFPEMRQYCIDEPAWRSGGDKCIQAVYTPTVRFAYAKESGSCRGSYLFKSQYRASQDYSPTKLKGQLYWTDERTQTDSVYVSEALKRCKAMKGGLVQRPPSPRFVVK
jgi:hypothetical protein